MCFIKYIGNIINSIFVIVAATHAILPKLESAAQLQWSETQYVKESGLIEDIDKVCWRGQKTG